MKQVAVLSGLIVFTAMLPLVGQDKKPDPKDMPRVLLSIPLGVPVGATSKVTLRGLKLDSATEVRVKETGAVAKLLGKGKAIVPNMQEPGRVGDTQVEVEVPLPANFKGDTATLVVSAGGLMVTHRLLVTATPPLSEKEPNNSFRQAQSVKLPQVIDGAIANPLDVDVFRFEGKHGQQVVLEVLAERHGSALDSLLTLYDVDGQIVAVSDDIKDSSDSRIEAKLPRDGVFYLSLIDAHDQGGPAHVYRLVLRVK